jgi:TetR/AcrR family transcriptional regulator, tetracycline repressor protein
MDVNLSAAPAGGRSGRRPGRPPLLAREQVLACALGIVDRDGLTALTMRRLGTELGVDPMAVYRHVGGKSGLYDGVVEHVFAQVDLPPRRGDWPGDLAAIARALRTTLLAHPSALSLLGTRPPATPASFRIIEAAVTVLLDAGFSPQDAADGVDCTGRLVVGHVLAQAGPPPSGDTDGGEAEHEQTQHALPQTQFPGLAAVTRAGVRHDPERLFELGLQGIQFTLAAQLQRSSGTEPGPD